MNCRLVMSHYIIQEELHTQCYSLWMNEQMFGIVQTGCALYSVGLVCVYLYCMYHMIKET